MATQLYCARRHYAPAHFGGCLQEFSLDLTEEEFFCDILLGSMSYMIAKKSGTKVRGSKVWGAKVLQPIYYTNLLSYVGAFTN